MKVPVKTKLPESIIKQYWAEVRQFLIQSQGLSPDEATRSIRSYRTAVKKHGIGDTIYHADIHEIAQGIVDGGYINTLTKKAVGAGTAWQQPAKSKPKPTAAKQKIA